MLTGEEQWKILLEEKSRTGQGERKKKKNLMEQLQDMGGFGHDPDSEQAITKELERRDTRAPLLHSQASISECEVSFGESSFWESRKRLFNSWLFRATRMTSWIQEKDLPLFFRFALRRPIMDAWSFQAILQSMDLRLETSTGDTRQPYTSPIGRSRQLLFGIDKDQGANRHPSDILRHILPKGAAEKMVRARAEATRIVQQDDEDMQQLVQRQLWTVYEHLQNGSVPLESAAWHYRDALNTQDMSDETLVICLEYFGMPTDHVSGNRRSARRGSDHCPFPSDEKKVDNEIGRIAAPDKYEKETIKELVSYVGLYRQGVLEECEVLPMIQHRLDGLVFEANDISDILTDFNKDEETAGLLIWEACANEDSSTSSGTHHISSSSSSSSEEEKEESHGEQEDPLPVNMSQHSHADEEKDEDTAAPKLTILSKSSDGPTTKDIDYRHDSEEMESTQSEAMTIDNSLTISPSKLPTYNSVDEAESRMLPARTPRPKLASLPSTEKSDDQASIEFAREPSLDRANIRHRRLSSPDEGMTDGIWGLLMPTKDARKLAYQLKLPQDYVDEQVRSISPRSARKWKATHAKTVVTFPKSKRKASMALLKDTPKSPKHSDHTDLFAMEGEDQETFVLSHFDRDKILSKYSCKTCLCLRCKCERGSSPRSSPPRSSPEPDCPKCLQKPCTCGGLPHPNNATQTAAPKGNPSSDTSSVKFPDRTRPEPPKQPATLLAYLGRVLDDDDVLASIKQLERAPAAHSTIAYAKTILNHMYQGTRDGGIKDVSGRDDGEAIRVIEILRRSSQELSDHLKMLKGMSSEKDASAASVNGRPNEARECPNTDSSLLDSSPDHEYVPATPSNKVASTATNIANVAVFKANDTPLAKHVSPYLPRPAPDSSVPHLELSSGIEDAPQPSQSQTASAPDSSAAGASSRAERRSGSPGRGKLPTAGGHPSKSECPSESPTTSPLSSTTNPSEEVSDHPVDVEGDTDNIIGTPLTRQPHSNSRDMGDDDVEMRTSPSPRPAAKRSDQNAVSSSPRVRSRQLSNSMPPARPRLGSEKLSNKPERTFQVDKFSPGYDSLPLWPPQSGLSGKAGTDWMGMTPKKALEYAKKDAFRQRKSLAFYLEQRRAIRPCIKKENDFANSECSTPRFFQSSNGLSSSSATGTTQALNKLFDKYRGTSNIWLRLRM